MGAICCGSSEESTVLTDLRERSCNTGDKIEEWELKLPFSRCSFAAYAHALKLAHEESGGKGFVKMASLIRVFPTKAWKKLRDPASPLRQHLETHLYFPRSTDDSLDFKSLMMMGLLYGVSGHNSTAKAREFYDLLQTGGAEKQSCIAARDKDWIPVLNRLFTLATLIAAAGAGQIALYTASE